MQQHQLGRPLYQVGDRRQQRLLGQPQRPLLAFGAAGHPADLTGMEIAPQPLLQTHRLVVTLLGLEAEPAIELRGPVGAEAGFVIAAVLQAGGPPGGRLGQQVVLQIPSPRLPLLPKLLPAPLPELRQPFRQARRRC